MALGFWNRRPLYEKIVVFIIIGALIGIFMPNAVPYIRPLGVIFIRLLKMLVVPLTFFSLISGILGMGDIGSLRRIGLRILLMFAVTITLSAATGAALGLFFGVGSSIEGTMAAAAPPATGGGLDFGEGIAALFPTNIVEAMAAGNMIQVIVFSVFAGITLLALGEERAGSVTRFVRESSVLMIKMANGVMAAAPYGIMALVAEMMSSVSGGMLLEAGRLIAVEYLAFGTVMFVIYPILLKFCGGLAPARFFRNIAPAMLVAAATMSSAATLPVSMRCAEERLGLQERAGAFGIPLGANIGMNGLAVFYGILSIFTLRLYGVPITPTLLLRFIFLGLALTMGAASVNGASIVGTTLTLSALGLPLTIMPFVAAVNPALDIGSTTLNVTGTLVSTATASARMKLIDMELFLRKKDWR